MLWSGISGTQASLVAGSNGRRTDFARSLQSHMEVWCDRSGQRPPMWREWTDGIYPAYRKLAAKVAVADSVELHEEAAHVRSSQAFAFNLFLPFCEGTRARLSEVVSEVIGVKLRIDRVQFEWIPPGALLGELAGERPVDGETATAVDVVLWSRLHDDRRAVVLVEVKLSEGGFTQCYGRKSRGNRRKDVCQSARLFFDNPRACYLRRPWRKQRDRRYWEIFAASHGSVRDAFPGTDMDGACPFALDAQQPMRNLAIARSLEQEGAVAKAWFVLCAHDHNPDVTAHWQAWREMLPDPVMAPSLPATKVIRVGEAEGFEDWAKWMYDRYKLAPAP